MGEWSDSELIYDVGFGFFKLFGWISCGSEFFEHKKLYISVSFLSADKLNPLFKAKSLMNSDVFE